MSEERTHVLCVKNTFIDVQELPLAKLRRSESDGDLSLQMGSQQKERVISQGQGSVLCAECDEKDGSILLPFLAVPCRIRIVLVRAFVLNLAQLLLLLYLCFCPCACL